MPKTSEAPEGSSHSLKRMLTRLAEKTVVPFLIVIFGIVFLDPVREWWIGPKQYKVYMVGSEKNEEIKRLFRGINLGSKLQTLQIDDVDVVVEDVDDQGANSVPTARDLAGRNDTLLVIGHVSSQRTIDALPVYMQAQPPIPLLATKETNPDLLKKVDWCKGPLDCPLLQMSPTDDQQAVDTINFALRRLRPQNQSKPSVRFLVVKQINEANKAYADYLTAKYETLLSSPSYISKGALHVGTVNIVDAKDIAQTISTIESMEPSCLLYVGNFIIANQFLGLFQEKFPEPSTRPLIMLSDASINPQVLKQGFGALDNVFATYPLSSAEYRETESILGRDASSIVQELIRRAGPHRPMAKIDNWKYEIRRALRMHRVTDARRALSAALEEMVISGDAVTGPTNNSYSFSFPFRRKDANFHVWQIKQRGITEVDQMDAFAAAVTLPSSEFRLAAMPAHKWIPREGPLLISKKAVSVTAMLTK